MLGSGHGRWPLLWTLPSAAATGLKWKRGSSLLKVVKTWAQTRSQLLNSSKVSDISVHGTPTLADVPGIPKSEEPRNLQMPTQKTPGDTDFAAASPLPPGSAEGSTDPEHRSHPSAAAARPIHTS